MAIQIVFLWAVLCYGGGSTAILHYRWVGAGGWVEWRTRALWDRAIVLLMVVSVN